MKIAIAVMAALGVGCLVGHGPSVYVSQWGELEIGFKIDGEWDGEVRTYGSDGQLMSSTLFGESDGERGIPLEMRSYKNGELVEN